MGRTSSQQIKLNSRTTVWTAVCTGMTASSGRGLPNRCSGRLFNGFQVHVIESLHPSQQPMRREKMVDRNTESVIESEAEGDSYYGKQSQIACSCAPNIQ